jgi:4-amino-4-deoxy-L-arabinose transferase-like glycosyltransferase
MSERRSLKLEVVLVVFVAALVFVPGIWKYSLVDPWETHYGEVAREMLQDHDLVHTHWNGTFYSNPNDNEGFRSKPVLSFWLMAAGMSAVGVAEDGGYSGEMVASARTMIGIRLPFILCAIAGLTLVWWMLARLVSRRLAWLALLVVGSTPMFAMIARNAIPDMPMVACTMGAIAMFIMAMEDGDRPIRPLGYLFNRRVAYDARHIVLALAGLFVLWQAAYYAIYFIKSPVIAIRGRMPSPALWLPLLTLLLFGGISRECWLIVRLPFVLVGGIIAAIVNAPMPYRGKGQSQYRHVFDNILTVWDRYALDRYLVAAAPVLILAALVITNLIVHVPRITNVAIVLLVGILAFIWMRVWLASRWKGLLEIVDHVLHMSALTSMRQVYLLACYFLLGISVLAKGPPGLTVVAGVGAFHVILHGKWKALYNGEFEIKRGLLMMSAVAVPWHVAMWLKDGVQFIEQYIFQHILNRAGDGSVDKSLGTFAKIGGSQGYTAQIGHGMWIWAALLPAALAVAFARADRTTREGRVRFHITVWAIVAVFVFCFVQTKFNHYILPAIPPLGLLVAFFLDDLITKRERLHAVFAVLAVGIALLITRDLMHEPERWIEMFVYRYDRQWPNAEPWQVDTSDGVLLLGGAAVVAIVVAAFMRRVGVVLIGAVGLAICIWALQWYMPHAGTHWGMREAVRTYYEQRTVYGETRVYFGARQCLDNVRVADEFSFETFIPDNLQIGQPMHLTLRLHRAADNKVMENEAKVHGTVVAIGDHDVKVKLFANERSKIETFIADCRRRSQNKKDLQYGRPPVIEVDADKLFAWQLYWRGENFWSGGEIWGWLPEMKTSFVPANNTEVNKYLADRTRAPLGRRYFVITEASRIMGLSQIVPTTRGRDTYEVLDTTSNKFSLAAFYL